MSQQTPEEGRALSRGEIAWRRRCRRKAIKHALEAPFAWLGIGLGVLILAPLPHRAMLAVCDGLSVVFFRLDRRGRRRALETLRIIRGRCTGLEGLQAFDPDKAPYDATAGEDRIVRRSYRNMARTVGHIFWTFFGARQRAAAVGVVDERIRAFLDANRPAITVSAHLGCWEILSQMAYLLGHRMMSVAKRIGSRGMTRMLMKARTSIGQEIIPADGALKVLLQGLKDGKSLGLLVDQSVDPNDGGQWVRFLGRPLPVTVAPAFFAAKIRAPILIAWSHPLKDGRYRCEYIDVISPEQARDIWGATQRCMAGLERVIRRHPSCWVMNYNEFSNIPTEADLAGLAKHEERRRA